MRKSAMTSLPKLSLPFGKELWEMAKVENWPELESLLDTFDEFYVRDAVTESHLYLDIRTPFDIECITPGTPQRSFIASLLLHSGGHRQGYAAELLRRLLALGLHPDLPTNGGGARWRPSHYCSWNNRKKAVAVLGVCRPDLGAKDIGGDTPRAIGQHGEELWRYFEREGFPTIARLAHDKKWWAVRNLTRRRVVSEDEKFSPYKDKDATQWAKYHGEMQEAEELNYFLHSGPATPLVRTPCELGPQLQAVSEKMASLQEKVDCDHESALVFTALVREHQGKLLEVVFSKGEADELKEAIALCHSRITREAENMRKDMVAVCEVAIAKERLKHHDEMNKAFQVEMMATLEEERESMRKEAKHLQAAMQARVEATCDAGLLNLKEDLRRQMNEMFLTGSPAPPAVGSEAVRPAVMATAEMGTSLLESRGTSTGATSASADEGCSSAGEAGLSLNPYMAAGFAKEFLELVNKYTSREFQDSHLSLAELDGECWCGIVEY